MKKSLLQLALHPFLADSWYPKIQFPVPDHSLTKVEQLNRILLLTYFNEFFAKVINQFLLISDLPKTINCNLFGQLFMYFEKYFSFLVIFQFTPSSLLYGHGWTRADPDRLVITVSRNYKQAAHGLAVLRPRMAAFSLKTFRLFFRLSKYNHNIKVSNSVSLAAVFLREF